MMMITRYVHMSIYNDNRSSQLWLIRVNVSPVIATYPTVRIVTLSDVATSAAHIRPLVAAKYINTALADSHLCREMSRSLLWTLAIAANSSASGGNRVPKS
ncbi:hypothetical protein AVEN_218635-1 [Araneus ventricosus]|uniref:Uncharacterized protein n=1 Tax=Araneus ventricosus TaxID=182803 RepID=A0A4Y2ULG2_ARAVE|nr:hypothetical protein AVEN_218635-1 [Araneus ventricosus]